MVFGRLKKRENDEKEPIKSCIGVSYRSSLPMRPEKEPIRMQSDKC